MEYQYAIHYCQLLAVILRWLVFLKLTWYSVTGQEPSFEASSSKKSRFVLQDEKWRKRFWLVPIWMSLLSWSIRVSWSQGIYIAKWSSISRRAILPWSSWKHKKGKHGKMKTWCYFLFIPHIVKRDIAFHLFIINQGPTSNGGTCYCEPFLHRCEQQMDRNKKEVLKHLSNTHGRLANRITSLEKKTKDQISYLSNSMKETIAQVNDIEVFRKLLWTTNNAIMRSQ